jgi:hypothetical protein
MHSNSKTKTQKKWTKRITLRNEQDLHVTFYIGFFEAYKFFGTKKNKYCEMCKYLISFQGPGNGGIEIEVNI